MGHWHRLVRLGAPDMISHQLLPLHASRFTPRLVLSAISSHSHKTAIHTPHLCLQILGVELDVFWGERRDEIVRVIVPILHPDLNLAFIPSILLGGLLQCLWLSKETNQLVSHNREGCQLTIDHP